MAFLRRSGSHFDLMSSLISMLSRFPEFPKAREEFCVARLGERAFSHFLIPNRIQGMSLPGYPTVMGIKVIVSFPKMSITFTTTT